MVFVTNNSARTPGEVAAELARHGIAARAAEVVTSSQAAATLVSSGETVLALGGPGVLEALGEAGAEVVAATELVAAGGRRPPAGIETVVVGITPAFDYDLLALAVRAVRAGARLVATNDDPTFPVDDGILPGNGALVAAVERAAGVRARVAGKPHRPMADLLARLLDPGDGDAGGDAVERVMVGDRPDTDGVFARRAGMTFALVLSGVTGADDLPVEPSPDVVADDLAGLVGVASTRHAG